MIDVIDEPRSSIDYAPLTRHPVIVLYGTGGLYNYGCEAIVRGTTRLLKQEWPQACVVYLSPRAKEDRARLPNVPISVLQREWYSRRHPAKWIAKAAKLLGLPVTINTEMLDVFRMANAVLSIGGDLYTLGFDARRYPKWLMASGRFALNLRRPYVVWGASIGPFERNPSARRAMAEHLRRVDLITARDPDTISYLATLGIAQNVVRCADPAFVLNTPKPRDGNACLKRIGINYSPLSAAYLGCTTIAQAAEAQARIIARIASKFDADVTLIPHAVCDFSPRDDDRRYAFELERFASRLTSRSICVDADDSGFTGRRRALEECDFVVAARMHCAINAMSLGIPTILVAYSDKSVGMARYVYGHDRWAVPIEATVSENVLSPIANMATELHEVHRHLVTRIPSIQRDARCAVIELAKLLDRRFGNALLPR